MSLVAPPLKPFPEGKLTGTFGGPSSSALDVLERTRVVLSPRGAWSPRGWSAKTHEGYARCLNNCFNDVDGKNVAGAQRLVLRAAKEITGHTYMGVPGFNDDPKTNKHTVILVLDRAIELAKGD